MDVASPLDDAFGPAFSRRIARLHGITDGRLRRSDLTAPYRGTRSTSPSASVAGRAAALATRLPADAVFSHVTAAQLLGVPLPARYRDDRPLDVSRPAHVDRVTGAGIAGHRLRMRPYDAIRIRVPRGNGGPWATLRVTSPASTWSLLAGALGVDDLIAAGDAALARTVVTTTLDELVAVAADHAGRRGARARTAALPDIRTDTWSRTETFRRLAIVRSGLPEPAMNRRVLDAAGRTVGTPDASFPEFRVLEQYEGDHHRDTAQFRRDIARDAAYLDAGWQTLKTVAGDVFADPNPSLRRLAQALRARGWNGPPHLPLWVPPFAH